MINRIILIGNGFDLAHGLKTSYKDFIRDYWFRVIQACSSNDGAYEDRLVDINHKRNPTISCYYQFEKTDNKIREFLSYENIIKWKSPFFEHLNKTLQDYNWVDIEYEYYLFLKKILEDENASPISIKQLNSELKYLQELLESYLRKIVVEFPSNTLNAPITHQLFDRINNKDISCEGQHYTKELFREREKQVHDNDQPLDYLYQYGKFVNIKSANAKIQKFISRIEIEIPAYVRGFPIKNDAPKEFWLPDNILFLNFNYTDIPSLYIPEGAKFKTIHIHGDLEGKDNPIIFGYGDEMDKSFKELLEQNDNSYLENIKSMHYAETDNYRNLLQFIESAPYQIYIMGHSCANSDRTLLNTLFEHKNCISIKPFYHKWKDENGIEQDDYLDKIQNISRNFNDMALMRDRVVNKKFCEPLGQYIP